MKKLYTVQQVADLLSVHPITIYRYIKQGKLKTKYIGRQYRITESDLDSFIENAKIF